MIIKNTPYKIHPIEVLQDNIIWVWTLNNQAVVVDPAVTEPVEAWLRDKKLSLTAILQTHHHDDHIGGTIGLLKRWPKAAVIASKSDLARIPFQTVSVSDGESLSLMESTIEVLEVSGHTKGHIAYYLPSNLRSTRKPAIFCGDTLFGAGCGRIFEGTAEDMYKALHRINALPVETEVYCAHEYTESNLKWASSIHPKDLAIKKRLTNVIQKRKLGCLSLPSTISEERETNLFIRAKSVEELSRLRLHKDNWQG